MIRESLFSFIKKFKKEIFISLIFFLIIYLFYFRNIISIDTEIYINSKEAFIEAWSSLGRWSLSIFVILFRNIPFNILIYRILSGILYFISVILFTHLSTSIINYKDKKAVFLSFLLLLSSPIFAEQFNFTLQSLFISFGFILVCIAFYQIDKYIYTNKKRYLIISTFLLGFCFGLYQAFVLLTISIFLFLLLHYKNIEIKDYNIKKLMKMVIIVFFLSFIFYYLMNIIVKYINGAVASDYLLNNFRWTKETIIRCILNIASYGLRTLLGSSYYHSIIFLVLFILLLYRLIKRKEFLELFFMISLAISPFLLLIITATHTTYRAQFSYVYVLLFLFLSTINKYQNKKIIYILVLIAVVKQTIVTATLFYNDYKRYNYDLDLAKYVVEVSKSNQNKSIIFTGSYHPKDVFKGETLGQSFASWDENTEMGVNNRMHGFLMAKKIKVKSPTKKEYEHAKKIQKNCYYPDKKCKIITDNSIIINLR